MKLYAHPFSSYSQKVLIALYENATPFEYRNLEDPSANAELASLWPLKRFPILVDQGRTILEASTIIDYLQLHYPGPVRMISEGDAGVEVRMLDRIFDNYVMTPMQKIVLNQLRPEPDRDSYGRDGGAGVPRQNLCVAR
jgi:glutathione S-transferase